MFFCFLSYSLISASLHLHSFIYKDFATTILATAKIHLSLSYGYEATTTKQFPHPSVFLDILSNYSLHMIKIKLTTICYIRNTYKQLKAILMRHPVSKTSS